jgi:hypothetical protein
MRSIALALLSLSLCAPAGAAPLPPDLSTDAGFRATCAALPRAPAQLRNNQQRQAFAVCRDVELVRNVATFIEAGRLLMEKQDRANNPLVKQMLRSELTHVRDELRTVRQVLEKIRLGKGEGLLLAPASWQLDLNGDGELKPWERYFFAIPVRGKRPFRVGLPNNDPAYYETEFQLDAMVRVDQSDIAWALSYHYFAESLVETVLSYTVNTTEMGPRSIELVDPAGMKRANALMVRGFRTSELMRRSVLAETDDDHEWIGNPGQHSSVFPLALDQEDFKVWGEVLAYVIPLFEGKTLLAGDAKAGGMIGGLARTCPAGQGMNVTRFYDNPPRYPLEQANAQSASALLCQPIDKAHPASGLVAYITEYARRAEGQDGTAMLFLRQLVWVN